MPIVLFLGVAAMSSAAIMIRLAQQDGAPSLVIAFFRLLTATLALTPVVLLRQQGHEVRQLDRMSAGIILVSGVFLAFHFATWIASLEYTSVMSSVVLVSTTPIWIGLASPLLLQERLSIWTWIAIGVALLGSLLISSSGDGANHSNVILGNGLALTGAITGAGYLLIGRRVRNRISLITYLWLVYGAAALGLLGLVAISGHSLAGYSARSYILMITLGLIPQLFGHSAANYSLRYLPAVVVSLALLGEPIGSSLLAAAAFGERPRSVELAGAALIVVGIGLAAIFQERAGKKTLISPTEAPFEGHEAR